MPFKTDPTICEDPFIVLATKAVFADLFLFGYDSVTGIGVALKTRGRTTTDTPAISIAVRRKLPPSRLPPGQRIPGRLPAFDLAGQPIPNLVVLTDIDEEDTFALAGCADFKSKLKIGGEEKEFNGTNIARVRPLEPGFSTGLRFTPKQVAGQPAPSEITTIGTIGARLIDQQSGGGNKQQKQEKQEKQKEPPDKKKKEFFFLTCAHVAVPAASFSGAVRILQTAPDDPQPKTVGRLDRYAPYPEKNLDVTKALADKFKISDFNPAAPLRIGETAVDAAVVEVEPRRFRKRFRDQPITAKIRDIGFPTGTRALKMADMTARTQVRKSGRTSGLTKGRVIKLAYDKYVGVGLIGPGVLYRNQILVKGADTLTCAGDSGALVLDTSNVAVGLLVAGSGDDDGRIMLATPIDRVLTALNAATAQKVGRSKKDRMFVLATSD